MFAGRHDYVFTLHTDTPRPHVHLAICSRGHAGERLNPKKADLELWRQTFAQALRDRGIEAEANWKLGQRLNGYLTYSFVDSEVTENAFDPASIGKQQPGIPRHKVTAGLTWSGPHGLKITPQMRYLPRSNGDPDGLLTVDAHFIVDFAASLPVTDRLEAFAQVENLFDEDYIADNSGFSPPLRGTPLTAFAGVRLKLN